jgi:hypothetical protein
VGIQWPRPERHGGRSLQRNIRAPARYFLVRPRLAAYNSALFGT